MPSFVIWCSEGCCSPQRFPLRHSSHEPRAHHRTLRLRVCPALHRSKVSLENTLHVSAIDLTLTRGDMRRDPSPKREPLSGTWCALDARNASGERCMLICTDEGTGGATHVREMHRLWRGPVMVLKSLVQPSVSCRHGRGLTKQSYRCPGHSSGLGTSPPLAGLNGSGSPRLAWLYRSVKRFVAPPPAFSRARWQRGLPNPGAWQCLSA